MQKFRNLKTATKLNSLTMFMAVFLGLVGLVGIYSTYNLAAAVENMYQNNLLPVKWVNGARGQTRAVEALTLEVFMTQDQSKQQEILQEMEERVAEVDTLLADYSKADMDAHEQEQFAKLMDTLQLYRTERDKAIDMATAGNQDEAFRYFSAHAASQVDAVNDLLKELADYNAQLADEEEIKSQAKAAMTSKVMVGITLVAIVLALGIGRFIARLIANPLIQVEGTVREIAQGNLTVEKMAIDSEDEVGRLAAGINAMTENLRLLIENITHTAEQVAASSEELTASAEQSASATNSIAATITEVAAGAARQEAAVDNAASIVEEMSAGIQQVAATANSVSRSAELTANAAGQGDKAVNAAVSQMKNIEKTVAGTAQVVTQLGERSKEIGQIVDAISGIAAQTNLLALNAAIEAARAGEQGRGFAVVAEEVRKLAEQSQEAAKQIAGLIAEIQKETLSAVKAMNEGTHEVKIGSEVVNSAGEAFDEIVGLIGDVSTQVREISAAIQQMASGSQQIVDSVRDIDRVSKEASGQTQTVSAATEEQSASIEEVAASSEELAKMAEELQRAVRKFRI
ncbi:methyl-accepting chemotaxis sensory transducer [Desulfitobacterium hafniense DCB-2]|uniref:Methyl-accepting chemotaxis sensory transducer n=1 Tax=Desulfitobacterium hafniense (strain DSM 10664 / DCB-2) TaxID=272564 RepID=B8FS10_DESHD|nr:methyl-accepting chemotaxis protein [Desulfitobacterium hafniense]ACL20148.1 methyl-accepting chemotaxis sensory transducer [Desulfitobacterium hafniense DCB-2]